MQTDSYVVSVVLDEEYGDDLAHLLQVGPVWIVDTDTNRLAAERAWTSSPNGHHLHGVTLFKVTAASAEDTLSNTIGEIDLHHGVYSANPPYTVLNVIGTSITDRLRDELSEYGLDHFHLSGSGFRAVRPLPQIEGGAAV